MKTSDLKLPAFQVPPPAGPPSVSPETYARWVAQNIARLRDSGELDALCSAREPVNVRFTFPNAPAN